MVESNGLLPILMGIGLAALSGGTLASSRSRGQDAGWRDPLFVFAALLIGLSVFGVALYVLGWSIETGRKLPRAEARAENWLILTLALLLVAVAARSAWIGLFQSSNSPPWEHGYLDRLSALPGFAMATLAALLVGLLVDLAVLLVAKAEPSSAILLVIATLVLGLASAWAVLRLMIGVNPSPRASLMSRTAQLKMLAALDGAAGEWKAVEVTAIGRLDPALSLSATVWMTVQGMFLRVQDAYALSRYHSWVADHLLAPTPAVHEQRLMVTRPTRRDETGPGERRMEIKPWTGPRARWLDAVSMHRRDRPDPADLFARERMAGLVHVPYEQLSAAGLRLIVAC